MTRSNDAPVPIDPEHGFEDIVALLEALAESDRAKMPAELVDRTMVRTQSLLGRPEPSPVVRRFPLMRIAAVLGVLVSLGALLIVQRPGTPRADASGDSVLARTALDLDLLDGPDWVEDLDAEIAVLLAESTMLDGELDRELADFDLFHDEGAL